MDSIILPFRKRFLNIHSLIYLIVCIVRCIITGVLLYRYVVFSSGKEIQKWGTFVEAIYEPISYLPYRGDVKKNLFYQTLLFHGCQTWAFEGICNITTKDDKTFLVSLSWSHTRSDQKPITIDDVLFTYKDIVIENRWQQPYLLQYSDITINRITGENTLQVTFPFADNTNKDFFSFPILPSHTIKGMDTTTYINNFSNQPVTSTCATLWDNNNENNLVINMSRCNTIDINYYQLKSFGSYKDLIQYIWSNKKNDISLYEWVDPTEWYRPLFTPKNEYMTMFFNTLSPRLSPRIQRSLWWLIYKYFSSTTNSGQFIPYQWLLSHQQSDGSNASGFIMSKNPNLEYDKQGLEKAGVKKLWQKIYIEWLNVRQAYYIEWSEEGLDQMITIETAEQFSNTKVRSSNAKIQFTIQSNSTYRIHNLYFSIGWEKWLREWVNTITVQWTQKWVLKTIAVIDLYYLGNITKLKTTNKLKVIYFKDPSSEYTINTFKNIIEREHMSDLFDIESFNDTITFASAINEKKYDIAFTPVSITSPSDIAALLINDSPEKNPSLYKNIELVKLLDAYASQESKENKRIIQDLFSTDMPFTILGQNTNTYRLKDSVLFSYTGTMTDTSIRKTLLDEVHIVSHSTFRAGKLIEIDNLKRFITQELQQ